MRYLEDRVLDRGAVHGEWNYTVRPAPRPAPEPDPDPERPRPLPPGRPEPSRADRHGPRRPARPGRRPGSPVRRPPRAWRTTPAAAAAASTPSGTAAAPTATAGSTSPTTCSPSASASTCTCPSDITGALLGVDGTTVGHATALTRQLLASTGIPLPPAAPPPGTLPRTPDELLRLRRSRRDHPHHPGQRPGHAATLQDTRREPATRPELITDAAYAAKTARDHESTPSGRERCGQWGVSGHLAEPLPGAQGRIP